MLGSCIFVTVGVELFMRLYVETYIEHLLFVLQYRHFSLLKFGMFIESLRTKNMLLSDQDIS